jgi:phosphoglycerate dehydrogenase-like enzyme
VTGGAILVLDSLYPDLEIEEAAARSMGWTVDRWDGSSAALAAAEIVVHVRTQIDVGMLARMPRCRVVGRFGTGIDSVDLEAAEAAGVDVVSCRGYCTSEVTAHTLGLAFALERRISWAANGRLGPDTDWQEIARTWPIPGRIRATVIGLGAIGESVARALVCCGYILAVVDPYRSDLPPGLVADKMPLEAGLSRADLAFLHAALTHETTGLIDRPRLALMPQGAILIDTARPGLLDEAAVAESLASGHLGGLGLDARLEPYSPLRRLLGDPRVLVTPHIGWYSERSAAVLRQRTIVDSIAKWEAVARAVSSPAHRRTSHGGENV